MMDYFHECIYTHFCFDKTFSVAVIVNLYTANREWKWIRVLGN